MYRPNMLFILPLLLLLSSSNADPSPSFQRLQLPFNTFGPDSLAFDLLGQGPYTGVSDGRILKYQGPTAGFREFAYTSPIRNKTICVGNITATALASLCGRPLGLGFDLARGVLYIADAYLGLHVAPASGGLATRLATSAEGVPFRFLDALGVDPTTGIVYFTDLSSVFDLSQVLVALAVNDSTGRLLSYNPSTKAVKVLLRGLGGAAGVAVSADGSFLLVTEIFGNRVRKYWLKGPRANTSEILVPFISRPDNIKRTPTGEFLVASNVLTPLPLPYAVRINAFGTILERTPLKQQLGFTLISEVQQFRTSRYIGSLLTNYVGVYTT